MDSILHIAETFARQRRLLLHLATALAPPEMEAQAPNIARPGGAQAARDYRDDAMVGWILFRTLD